MKWRKTFKFEKCQYMIPMLFLSCAISDSMIQNTTNLLTGNDLIRWNHVARTLDP